MWELICIPICMVICIPTCLLVCRWDHRRSERRKYEGYKSALRALDECTFTAEHPKVSPRKHKKFEEQLP